MADLYSSLEIRGEVLPVGDGSRSPTIDVDEPASVSPDAVTRDSVIAMFGGVISQGFKFLTLIYLARRFSTVQFGMVVFAMAINAFIFVFSNFGLPVYGTREVSERGYVSSRLFYNITLTRVVLALLSTAGALAILALMPMVGSPELTLVAVFGLSNLVLAGFLDWAFQGLARQDVSAVLNVIWQVLWFVFIVLATRSGMDIIAVPLAMCAAALIASLTGYLWLKSTRRIIPEPRTAPLIRESWKTLQASAHVGFGALLITVLVWTDAIIVRMFWGQQMAGQYAAGSRPSNALVMLCGFFILGAFPQLSRASFNREQFARCFQRAYSELALIYIPFGVWGLFYAQDIVLLVFKRPEYLPSVPVFQLFQVAMIISSINLLFGTGALLSYRRDRAYQTVLRNTTIIFLIVCVVLTRFAGMIGTAIAIPVSQVISLMLFLGNSRDLVRPHHARALLPPLLCTAAAVGLCRLLALRFWHGVIVLFLAYATLLLLRALGTFSPNAESVG